MSELLVAVSSGFVEDDGRLVEITAGKSRIAPEVLLRPGYSDFFESGVSVRGSDAQRCEVRACLPTGEVVAWPC